MMKVCMDWEAAFSLPASTRQRILGSARRRATLHVAAKSTSSLCDNAASVDGKDDASSIISRCVGSQKRMFTKRKRIPKPDANHEEDASGLQKRMLIKKRHQNMSQQGDDGNNIHRPSTGLLVKRTQDRPLPGHLLCADFFKVDALDLAPRLLGKFLRRDDVVLQITEVEAYRPNDSACHGRFGVTARTAPVFGPGGHAYVYLCYGLHIMLNIVADLEGVGAAVLIRSCAPISGMNIIQSRRGLQSDKPVLLTGPGKVGQALGLTTEWSNHPLFVPGGLELLDGPAPENILVGPRVGISYATPEDVAALWRFAVAGTSWISAPHSTLTKP